MHEKRLIYTLASIIALAVVLLVVHQQGNANRVVAPGKTDLTVSAPEEAYGIWKANNVRGRVLVLFDRYPHITGRTGYDGQPRLTSANVIEFSVFENIVRRIYLVVPDRRWSAFLRQDWVRPLRSFSGAERALYLGSRTGVPLVAVTPSSFPQLNEPVLIYINTENYDEREARELLSEGRFQRDVVITVRSTAS